MKRGKYLFASVMITGLSLLSGCVTPPTHVDSERDFCGDIYCESHEICCNDVCVAKNDPNHCGACDNACNGDLGCMEVGGIYQCLECGGQACSATCCTIQVTEHDESGVSHLVEQEICTAIKTNKAHCGACGNACVQGQTCDNGVCVCMGGTQLCHNECTALSTMDNCGDCDVKCPDATDEKLHLKGSSCSMAYVTRTYACSIECADGYKNANGDISDGCETPTFQPSTCGNNKAESDELCDGTDLRGETCLTLPNGYTGGTLKCDASCMRIDDSGCIAETSKCGNSQLDDMELCDGTQFRGSSSCYDYSKETPNSPLYASGNLSCKKNCTLDLTDCEVAQCQDGEIKCVGNSLVTCENLMWPTTGGTACSGQTPKCDDASKSCVGCLADADCSTGHCDQGAKKCVECLSNDHCSKDQTCDPETLTCKSTAVADWSEIVKAASSIDMDYITIVDSTNVLKGTVLDGGNNAGALNIGPWPTSENPDFNNKYVEIHYPATLFAGKTQLRLRFNYNVNAADKGPGKIAVALYDGSAQVEMWVKDAGQTSVDTFEFQQAITHISEPKFRVIAYKNAKENAGTLRIFPIEIMGK